MKDLVEKLAASRLAKDFLEAHEDWVQTKVRQFKISSKYIRIQVLLHLPYYDENEILNKQSNILRDLDTKLTNLCQIYSSAYNKLYHDTKLSLIADRKSSVAGHHILTIDYESNKIPISFGRVPRVFANEINANLHYIHSTRDDSIVNYGLYMNEAIVPYATASFSKCNREYQLNALNRAIGLKVEKDQVLSMTRAFAFNNAPKNSMSKLFHQSHEHIKREFPDTKVIITALNPFIGFNGGIFTGASYTPYALSPMEYWYDDRGYYVPRSKGKLLQKTCTPPIIWLVHGLDKNIAKAIDVMSAGSVENITRDEYEKG